MHTITYHVILCRGTDYLITRDVETHTMHLGNRKYAMQNMIHHECTREVSYILYTM